MKPVHHATRFKPRSPVAEDLLSSRRTVSEHHGPLVVSCTECRAGHPASQVQVEAGFIAIVEGVKQAPPDPYLNLRIYASVLFASLASRMSFAGSYACLSCARRILCSLVPGSLRCSSGAVHTFVCA